MSWSEIKKSVNSDLETPLDSLITTNTNTLSSAISDLSDNVDMAIDLLEYDNFTNLKTLVTGNTTGTISVLTITGSGYLKDCYLYNTSNSLASHSLGYRNEFRVFIDGDVVLDMYYTSKSSNCYISSGIFANDRLYKQYDTTNTTLLYGYDETIIPIYTSGSTYYYATTNAINFPSSSIQSVTSSTTYGTALTGAFVDGLIPFNESLIVQVIASSTSYPTVASYLHTSYYLTS